MKYQKVILASLLLALCSGCSEGQKVLLVNDFSSGVLLNTENDSWQLHVNGMAFATFLISKPIGTGCSFQVFDDHGMNLGRLTLTDNDLNKAKIPDEKLSLIRINRNTLRK